MLVKYELTPEDWMLGVPEYCMLIDKVRTFDLDAAYKLVDMARDKTILQFNFGDKLAAAFQWDSTPEGWQYWHDLRTKLEQLSPTQQKYYKIKRYFDMVRKVADIDMDAFHLLLKMPFLKRDFNYGDLEQAFTWSETEQGHYYWRKINSSIVSADYKLCDR